MKTLIIFICTIGILFACQKEDSPIRKENNIAISKYDVCPPLNFTSVNDARKAMNIEQNTTKSYVDSFISYAETVMQEDEYDNREYALQSESFGSILNSKGEVYIKGYYIRLINNGYILTVPDKVNEISNISSVDINSLESTSIDLGVNDPQKLYKLPDYQNVYFYDTFDLKDKDLHTRSTDGVQFLDGYDEKIGRQKMENGFTFPQGSDQKVTFPGHTNIANDTKIHREDNIFVSNCGVKTKTMKKGALGIWTKFECNIEAGVTDIIVEETWPEKPSISSGWYDINKTTFPGGREAIIATKYIIGSYSGISNSTVSSDCASALSWAKGKGLSVNTIDGVRYIYSNSSKAYIRLKNIGCNMVYEKKYVIDFDMAPIDGGKTSSEKGMVNGANFAPNKNCLLLNCIIYGYSEYDGVKRGSRVSYNINY